MTRLKKAMPWEDHVEQGTRLRQMHDYLVRLAVIVSNTYGSTKTVSHLAHKAHAALSDFRCELDNQLFRDHPERDSSEKLNVYYGAAGRSIVQKETEMSEPVASLTLEDWTDRETVRCECCGDPVFSENVVTTCLGGHALRVDRGCQSVLDWAHRVCKGKDLDIEVPSAVWLAVMASVWEQVNRGDPDQQR